MGNDLTCGMFSSIVCEVSKPGYSKILCLNKKNNKKLYYLYTVQMFGNRDVLPMKAKGEAQFDFQVSRCGLKLV